MATPQGTPTASSFRSPNRITRQQEKDELCGLNDRLAVYIETVRSLESQNSVLKRQLTESKSEVSRELSGLKETYDAELADARRTLDSVANERARLQLDLTKFMEENRELRARNTKNEVDLESAQRRVKDLEAALNSKEASLATALGEKRSLETENRGLRGQMAQLERSLEDTRKQLHDEMLRRVDGENRIQTLKEELEFQKNIQSQELREMQRRHESQMVEVDFGHQQEYECKLSEAMAEMRSQHDQQIKQYREEMENTYSAKLEYARQLADRSKRQLETNHEELRQTQAQLESKSAQVTQLQRQLAARDSTIHDLETDRAQVQENSRRQLREKDQEMSETRTELQKKLDEYQELMDVKLSLDRELHAYRTMLEGEEKRLSLSPDYPRPVSRRSGGHTPAKRRLYDDTDSEPSFRRGSPHVTKTQQTMSSSLCIVDEVDTDGKCMVVKNNGAKDQNLGNWQLQCEVADGATITFKFPTDFVLKAGQRVTIWGSEAGKRHNPPSDLVWKDQPTWGTRDMFQTKLINTDGEEIVMMTVMRTTDEDGEDDTAGPSTCSDRQYNLRERSSRSNR